MSMNESREQQIARVTRQAREEQGDAPDLFVHQTELRAAILRERQVMAASIGKTIGQPLGELRRKLEALSDEVTKVRAELDLLRAAAAKPATEST